VTSDGHEARVELFRTMARIAACDQVLRDALSAGQVTLTYYSPRGQEAVAAGACAALEPDDYLVTTYRGLHDQIAKGVPLRPLLAEMLGRSAGTGKGKGGPMHIVCPEVGLMLSTGVVGSGLPVAAGLAWAAQRAGTGRVALVSFGDGASNIGAFHETANLASLWELPLVLLCQNNGYGEHTAVARHQRVPRIAERAAAYAMAGVTVDGNDPVAVRDAVAEAAGRARAGGGPTLVEAVTYRLYGHVFGDRMTYIDQAELDEAWRAEPLARFRARLVADGGLEEDEADGITAAEDEDAAVALAEVMALPEPDASELLTDVVAEARRGPAADAGRGGAARPEAEGGEAAPVSVRSAITRALDEAMSDDGSVVLLGEDISDTAGGGVFGLTRGLSSKHGEDRVRDTPIAEEAIIGAAVGAALAGMRPVAEIMFMDFLGLCLDQLANHAAKLRYMSGGATAVPLVVRAAVGGGLGVGAQHSQMLEAWLTHVPGLKVVVPSTPADARALLRACIADDDPCVFIEQVPLLARRGPLDEGAELTLGRAEVKRAGEDVTVVTYGRQVHDALEVAQRLAGDGVAVEVLDLRSLAPLDTGNLFESVGRTGRAVVLHEAVVTGGFGGELAALLQEELYGHLRAPVLRVGAAPAPLPYASSLEQRALPGPDRLEVAVRRSLEFGARR
jgi:2-oxoisovalerate dehydrogenase E1 component